MFCGNSYRPLRVEAPVSDRVVAFARDDIVVVAPRLVRTQLQPGSVRLRDDGGYVLTEMPGQRYRSAIDGQEIVAGATGAIALADAFATLPVAVLTAARGPLRAGKRENIFQRVRSSIGLG